MKTIEEVQDLLLSLVNDKIDSIKPITDLDSSGFDSGLDSLSAVDITNEIEIELRIELDPSIFWEFETLRSLSDFIFSQLQGND